MEEAIRSNNPESLLHLRSTIQKDLPLNFLKDITNDFSSDREIGRGTFGVVYKGELQNGDKLAVKKLLPISPTHGKHYENEVRSLTEMKHGNVVELIGFCTEMHRRFVRSNGEFIREDTVEKLLCYEYFHKGSIDKLLFDETSILDWSMRFNIIKGICCGLHFLHKELTIPIIHMDLKPENILLDDNMVPKIADFGLSRLFGTKETHTQTLNVIGSIGYMAPEYILDGIVSTQSDIYSLGILIIEITTGERNKPSGEYMSAEPYIKNVRENWNNISHIASKYPSLDGNGLNQVEMCIQVGLGCVQHVRKKRPSIGEIVDRLNGGAGS